MAGIGKRMFISVIIPVYNGGETFQRCLEALQESNHDQWECIVIDDGSTDASGKVARSFGVKVIQSRKPKSGPAEARNLGAQLAGGSVLFFIDADVLVRPDTLTKVAAILRSDDSIAACFGSYDDAPVATNFLSQYRNLQHHYVHQTSSAEASTFWTGCGAIRRHIFLEMGGFNTAYARPSIEDIELGYRLRSEGYRIELDKSLMVSHMKRWTARTVIVTDVRDRAIPWARLILMERQVLNDLNLRTAQRVSTLAVYLGFAATVIGLFIPWVLLLAGLSIVVLIGLNWDFLIFLRSKRDTRFALLAVPWLWLYFAYSGMSFASCLVWYRILGFENPAAVMARARPALLEAIGTKPAKASTESATP